MARNTAPLTVDRLAELPGRCQSCLFWELDPVRRQRVPPEEAAEEKEGWVSGVLREWGSCGRVALVDDQVVGYVIYAPTAYVPGIDSFPTAPVSPDAVVMTTVYVDPAHTGGGIGRLLIQGMARDLIRRGGIRAVETFADARGTRGHCLVSGRVLWTGGLQDPAGALGHAPAADGPPHRAHLARRGRAGAGTADRGGAADRAPGTEGVSALGPGHSVDPLTQPTQ